VSKKGQHHEKALDHSQPRGHEKSEGRNDPTKSVTITTGNVKKRETYAEQARRHEDPGKPGQHAVPDWKEDLQTDMGGVGPRARDSDIGSGRSGSQSNQSK
jgi:hypothetical protein